MKIMCSHTRNSCFLTSLHDGKLISGSDYRIRSRPAKSSSLRSSSSISSFSDPRKWRHVALQPRTLMCAVQTPQANSEDGGPSLTEEYSTRQSADEVRKEILECYKLVEKLGRGVVYMGSARTKIDHSHYLQAKELAYEVALLLNCTSWTGAGPGMMDAATKGAMQAERPVGGFRISNEGGGGWSQFSVHPYLETAAYLTCRFFSARKHGLVEAGVRNNGSDRTAFICLPGGVGTLDELFEILTLIQLDRIGSSFPVPFLFLNYDDFYTNLLRFLATCREWGTVQEGEFEKLCHVSTSNLDALEYLADFYDVAEHDRHFRNRLQDFRGQTSLPDGEDF